MQSYTKQLQQNKEKYHHFLLIKWQIKFVIVRAPYGIGRSWALHIETDLLDSQSISRIHFSCGSCPCCIVYSGAFLLHEG